MDTSLRSAKIVEKIDQKRKNERNSALKLNKAFLSSTHSIQSRVDRKPQPTI
jgi:hypothetical protein